MSCMRGIEMWVKIGNVPCEREVRVEGVNTRWKVITGDVPPVEHSGHWSWRRWWFGGKRVIFGHVYVQDKYTVPGPVYRKSWPVTPAIRWMNPLSVWTQFPYRQTVQASDTAKFSVIAQTVRAVSIEN
ncbi:hypothetical protein B0H14DRAFT_2630631 [Mycena olivaceomarginata]|nr:hypothetical protein B0H14DRAFT_2630631 [Mycena olivaceomarginata]